MWGAPPDPCPPLHLLLALPGLVSITPTAFAVIELADLPHWLTWEGYGWCVVGRDPQDEVAWTAWHAAHPEV